jgi:uncharacterized protein involved in type VI secretion and phage assembly
MGNAGNGVVVGVVTSLDDPEGLGRVQVRLPYLGDDTTSDWAPVVSPMGGDGRGMAFRPEPEDTVLVAYEMCDPRRPYVLGGFWSRPSPPPDLGARPEANDWRVIRSRSGHVIRLDDTPGGERVEVVDSRERLRLVIDTAASEIAITADGGSIRLSATTIRVEAQGDLTLSGATVRIN